VDVLCGISIKKVACGTQFSVALTKDGKVFTFGQGRLLFLLFLSSLVIVESEVIENTQLNPPESNISLLFSGVSHSYPRSLVGFDFKAKTGIFQAVVNVEILGQSTPSICVLSTCYKENVENIQ